MPTLSELARHLESIGVTCCKLGDAARGEALVAGPGGRIMALTAPGSTANAFWTHPGLLSCRQAGDLATVGAGAPGGLRIWQAPESAYMWKGPADPAGFSNYQVQPGMDPGDYALTRATETGCVVEGRLTVADHGSGAQVVTAIHRDINLEPVSAQETAPGVQGVRLRFATRARLLRAGNNAVADLWNLMQLPAGTMVGAGIHAGVEPLVYFNPRAADGWRCEGGHFLWHTNGRRQAKFGLGARSATGCLFAVRRGETGFHVCHWKIPLHAEETYVDSPPGGTRSDQAVQFWDGFGFCEVEYHTPGMSLARPEIEDASDLTCLMVPAPSAARVAERFNLPLAAFAD